MSQSTIKQKGERDRQCNVPSSADVIFSAVLVLILIHHISDHFRRPFRQCRHDKEGKISLFYFTKVRFRTSPFLLSTTKDRTKLHSAQLS